MHTMLVLIDFFFFLISVVYVLFVFLFILAATWPVSWVSLEWTVPRSVHVTTRTATQCQGPATYVRNPSCLSLGKANVISPAFCYVICYGDTEELLKCWDILVGSSISHIFHYVKGRGEQLPSWRQGQLKIQPFDSQWICEHVSY